MARQQPEVPEAARSYYDFQDELTVQDPLVFKGPVVVIPAALRAEMMAKCHAMQHTLEWKGASGEPGNQCTGQGCQWI